MSSQQESARQRLRDALSRATGHGQGDEFLAWLACVKDVIESLPPDEAFPALGKLHGCGHDVYSMLASTGESNDEQRAKVKLLLPAVAHASPCTVDEGLKVLRFADITTVGYRFEIAEQLKSQFAGRDELAVQLGNALIDGTAGGEAAMWVWAGAFAGASPEAALHFSTEAIGRSNRATLLGAILLTFFNRKSPLVREAWLAHEKQLVAGVLKCIEGHPLEYVLWRVLTILADVLPAACDEVVKVLSHGPEMGLEAVANWLTVSSTPAVFASNLPLEDVLRSLLGHSSTMESLRKALDQDLDHLLGQDATKDVAETVFSELGTQFIDVRAMYPDATSALADDPQRFARFFTRWLVQPNTAPQPTHSLMSQSISGHALISLDAATFSTADFAGRKRLMRRLLAWAVNGPLLCQFAAQLAETPEMQPDGLKIALGMFEHFFPDYPNLTEEFLKQRLDSIPAESEAAQMYRMLHDSAREWGQTLANLPDLKELRIPDVKHFALRQIHSDRNRDINRRAKDLSFFGAFVLSLHIKQGRRYVTRRASGVSEIVEMQSMEHSIDLPSSEVADPVGGWLERLRLIGGAK